MIKLKFVISTRISKKSFSINIQTSTSRSARGNQYLYVLEPQSNRALKIEFTGHQAIILISFGSKLLSILQYDSSLLSSPLLRTVKEITCKIIQNKNDLYTKL